MTLNLKIVSIYKEIQASVKQTLEKSGFYSSKLEKLVIELIILLSSYQEEGVRLYPNVVIFNKNFNKSLRFLILNC